MKKIVSLGFVSLCLSDVMLSVEERKGALVMGEKFSLGVCGISGVLSYSCGWCECDEDQRLLRCIYLDFSLERIWTDIFIWVPVFFYQFLCFLSLAFTHWKREIFDSSICWFSLQMGAKAGPVPF